MGIEIKPLRYGHSDGHTDTCYSLDGEKFISCGGDGDVRVWAGYEDDDPQQTCLGEFALCVQQKNGHIAVGTDSNSVQLVEYPSGNRDGILTRFTAQVNHMAVGLEHNWIALGSEDMNVKLMELSTKDTKIFAIKAPALSVALCPNVKFMSVSCGDGKLIIYDIQTEAILKELFVVAKANSFMNATLLCRAAFDQKHGNHFAYPDKNQIKILNTSDWSELHVLSANGVDEAFSLVSFSPCSNYVCGASLKGDLVVWALRSQTVVNAEKHPKGIAITSIAWDPRGNGELVFGDVEGYIGLAVNCIDSDEPRVSAAVNELPLESYSNDVGMDFGDDVDFGDVQIQEDDEDNENAISLEKLKRDVMGSDNFSEVDKESNRSRSPRETRARTPVLPLQSAFMPGSTPEHLDPRYMCWNEVGVVKCYGSNLDADDEGTRSIEVEFHDTTIHNSMMMPNYQNYTMGTISTAALVVANSNVCNVVPLGGGASIKEWHLNLSEDEEITCIAASHNIVCLATANYLVHVCSIFGTQKCVLAIPGPILAMSAFGHVLLVAYHAASARKDDQCIECMMVKMEGVSVESRNIKCTLAPGAELQWIGFTDVGTPAIMDYRGMLFLHPLQCNMWLPFCDTNKQRKSPMDGFFVIAIYESLGNIRGIRCKGSQYPVFTPRPIAIEIALQAPFIEMDTEKAQLESNLFTWSTLQIENTDKKYKETALKAFALAAKNNLDQRALELIEMLGNSQILNLAMKYTSKLDKKRLTERLLEIVDKMNNDSDQNTSEISTPTNSAIKPNRKLMLSSTSKIMAKTKSQSASPRTFNNPTPSPSSSIINSSGLTLTMSGAAIDSQILEDEPKNPFLKNFKKPNTSTYNPLSLTDKYAGFNVEKEQTKENKNSMNISAEKRKQPDSSPSEKTVDKQRKMNSFIISKRT